MRKRIIFIIFGGAILIVILVALTGINKSSKPIKLFPYVATPTPVGAPASIEKSSISLVSIDPKDNQDNVAVNQTLHAIFTQSANAISFNIYPDVAFTPAQSDNSVNITFSQPLDANTVYTYSFLDGQGKVIQTGKFTTGLASESIAPLSGSYDNLAPTADSQQREDYPDVFLATYTPYETTSFSVTSDFDSSQNGQFFFTVLQKSPSAKTDFSSWLTSLGLTNTEIQKLDIRYQ